MQICLFIESTRGPTRLEATEDPDKRLKQLQNNNPNQLRIFAYCEPHPEHKASTIVNNVIKRSLKSSPRSKWLNTHPSDVLETTKAEAKRQGANLSISGLGNSQIDQLNLSERYRKAIEDYKSLLC